MPADFNGATSSDNSALMGVEQFYHDPILLCLIEQALNNNRELKILNQDIYIASNEIWSRSGAYLPMLGIGAGAGTDKPGRFTRAGAVDDSLFIRPGQPIPNPLTDFSTGFNLAWQIDVWGQLHRARDAAIERYFSAIEARNYFVTQLVAEVAEDYYRLMALDKRIENLNQVIELFERSLDIARARKEFAAGDELAVLRFESEVRRNQSEKLIITQDIIQTENRINYALNRYPMPVERNSNSFFDLQISTLSLGIPPELLQNRPDIREAERALQANGLDVTVARFNFYPKFMITGAVGYEAFDTRYFWLTPESIAANVAGGLVAPFINKRAIQAEYMNANARQLQSIYEYQRVIVNAFTQVVNQMAKVENYTNSVEIKKEQLRTLDNAVVVANNLFQNASVDYMDVLTAQKDLRDSRMTLIDTKEEQLVAIAFAYQSLGGGTQFSLPGSEVIPLERTLYHTVHPGETFRTIAYRYYRSERFAKALWAANQAAVPDAEQLPAGVELVIPPVNQLDQALIEPEPPALPMPYPTPVPGEVPNSDPIVPLPRENMPEPLGGLWKKDPEAQRAAARSGMGEGTSAALAPENEKPGRPRPFWLPRAGFLKHHAPASSN